MAEARNIRTLSMQQTPLLGELNTPLRELVGRGSGFEGSTPRASSAATPNPLATPLRYNGSEAGATPRTDASATPLRTPMRDSLQINPSEDGMSSVGDTPRQERMRLSELKNQLKAGFRNLPQAKNEFELVLPDDDEVEEENEEVRMAMRIEDATERESKLKAIKAEEVKRELARRTQVLKRGLPRPAKFDSTSYLASLAELKLDSADDGRAEVERLVAIEMVHLLEHDAITYPLAGSKRVGGGTSSLEFIADDALAAARQAVHLEIAQAIGLPGANEMQLKRALTVDVAEFDKVWKPAYDQLSFDARTHTYVPTSSLNDAQKIAGYAALLEASREQMTKDSTKAAKVEKKLGVVLGGYQARTNTLTTKLAESYGELARTRIEFNSFDRLAENEQGAMQRRMEALREEVQKLERKEREGQGRFRELNDVKIELSMRIEALEMEEAEAINDAALEAMDQDQEVVA